MRIVGLHMRGERLLIVHRGVGGFCKWLRDGRLVPGRNLRGGKWAVGVCTGMAGLRFCEGTAKGFYSWSAATVGFQVPLGAGQLEGLGGMGVVQGGGDVDGGGVGGGGGDVEGEGGSVEGDFEDLVAIGGAGGAQIGGGGGGSGEEELAELGAVDGGACAADFGLEEEGHGEDGDANEDKHHDDGHEGHAARGARGGVLCRAGSSTTYK